MQKDNSCQLSTVLKATDAVDYPPNGDPALVLGKLKLDPKAPTAYFTIRAKVMCNDGERVAAKNEFCHVVNRYFSYTFAFAVTMWGLHVASQQRPSSNSDSILVMQASCCG